MTNGRYAHTASLLTNGQVLVTGGTDLGPYNSVEIFDPVTRRWSLTGPMEAPRAWHTSCRIVYGNILVTGGLSFGSPLASA